MEGSLSPNVSAEVIQKEPSHEVSRLEQQLVFSEYKYSRDISRLQQALVRTKRLQSIYLVIMQLRLRPVMRGVCRLVMSCGFYKWKSKCQLQSNYRIRKAKLVISQRLRIILMREFVTFRERALRIGAGKILGAMPQMNGALAPLAPPEDH